MKNGERTSSSRVFLFAPFAFYLVFATIYNFSIPLGRGPDEEHHYRYVLHLVKLKSLPVLTDAHATRDERTMAIAIHPPLYYLMLTLPYMVLRFLPDGTIQHIFRFCSTLMGVITLWLILTMLKEVFPDRPSLPIATVSFAALLPHFLLLSSVINNDGLLILLSTLFLLWSLRLAGNGGRMPDFLRLGILYGLMLNTKASALSLAPVGAAVVMWLARRKAVTSDRGASPSWRTLAAGTFVFYATAAVIGGWWYARFYLMIGRIQPIPHLPQYEKMLLHSPAEWFTNPLAPMLALRHVAGIMRSIWGQVDWFLSPAQRDAMAYADNFRDMVWGPTVASQPGLFLLSLWLYRVFVVLTAWCLIGLVILAVGGKAGQTPLASAQKHSLVFFAFYFLLLYAALMHYTLFTHPGGFEGGRYLLPSIGAYATLFTLGLRACLSEEAADTLSTAVGLLLVFWNIACVVNLITVLNPLYAPGA